MSTLKRPSRSAGLAEGIKQPQAEPVEHAHAARRVRGRKPITAGGPTPEEIGRQV